ncbi:MAG: SCO family protein [Deltaproteobacteria bacterium]|nr:SCO family protein [Deltaproteobacteria bacterium]
MLRWLRWTPLLLMTLPQAAHACPDHDEKAPPTHTLRSVHRYTLPGVTLTDQDGKQVSLAQALPDDVPVAVNFVFTTCSTICPVMSATFSGLDQTLGPSSAVRLVSISIDPENDRPDVLKAYANRFHAPARWRFYTGATQDIRSLLTAFEAYGGDKSNHRPITLLRGAHGKDWVRIDGFLTAHELAGQLHALDAHR